VDVAAIGTEPSPRAAASGNIFYNDAYFFDLEDSTWYYKYCDICNFLLGHR
jgi:hypothetical protein